MNLIIPDKFRGTLTAAQAAQAISEGLGGDCLCCPMADGGEGSAEALPDLCVIESAKLIGHKSPLCGQSILQRSSYTLGLEIAEALSRHDGTVYIAVGGTVTADCGAGMLQALGAIFYDSCGRQISRQLCPDIIPEIHSMDISPLHGIAPRLHLLSDVKATLTGPGLSALDFLSQKGASDKEKSIISKALSHMKSIAGGKSEYDGAGGGIGYALAGILGCPSSLGADFILDHMNIDWSEVDLVATGEGCIDSQSLGGKTVGCILRKCKKMQKEAVAFGGRVAPEISDSRCVAVTPPSISAPDPATAYRLLVEAARNWAKKHENFSV
ncbi:MAG: glycerate kinase [Muribaculaceae bacterium]|nr:glycerate kinase [Muribaculaceae bacterium]